MLYETKHLVLDTRRYTLYTEQRLPSKINNVTTFCFKEAITKQPEGNLSGSLESRAMEEAKMLDKLGSNLSYAYFINDNNCYIIDTITVKLPFRHYMWVVLVAIISIGIAGLFIFLQVKAP